MKTDAEFSTRLKWLLLIIGSVLVTLVGLLLLYYDVTEETMAEPASQFEEPESTPETETPVKANIEKKLDLNSASQDQLETLPGVGETLAGRIIAFREQTPFKVVRDLKKVPGIGDAKFKAICDLVYVELPDS